MSYVKNLRKKIGHDPVILVGAVTVIINEKDEILLQQRKEPCGRWGLIGGLMELKESTEETAKREVLEESGLIVKKLNLIDVISGENCYIKVSNGDEFYSVTLAYYTKDYSGELKVCKEESIDMKFFKTCNLPKEIVGSHERIINMYLEKFGDINDRN